ncbi:hypothetical protein HBB16_21070 [Pseudonocardia sp. MCCB 268]|nr:hypothetical protein [Pseudonocardia cytotoxica]
MTTPWSAAVEFRRARCPIRLSSSAGSTRPRTSDRRAARRDLGADWASAWLRWRR